MANKLGSVKDWTFASRDALLVLPGAKLRQVRIDVTSGGKTSFSLMREGELAFPLGVVEGHGVLEFWSDGDVRVSGSNDFWYRTAEGVKLHSCLPDAVTFTKMVERRARNPELEYMQYMAEVNMNKRLNALRAEFERKYSGLHVDPNTGEVRDNGARKAKGAAKAAPADNAEGEAAGEGDAADTPTAKAGAGDGADKRPQQPAGQSVPPAA